MLAAPRAAEAAEEWRGRLYVLMREAWAVLRDPRRTSNSRGFVRGASPRQRAGQGTVAEVVGVAADQGGVPAAALKHPPTLWRAGQSGRRGGA